jgi:hypothetical protein
MRHQLFRTAIAIGLIGALAATGGSLGVARLPVAEAAAATEASEPSTEVGFHSHAIVRDGVTLRIEYCSNGPLEADPGVHRLVVMVHGSGRNACGSAAAGVEAARRAGTLPDTLVIAPHFITTEEPAAADEPDRLYWSTGGWQVGSNSRAVPHDRPWRMSSFAVVDDLVRTSAAVLPDLDDTVIAGHSAGGQFVNRYATSTRVAGHARFVIANPSSYLYLDARRFSGDTFAVPSMEQVAACPDYDTYKYGMNGLYAYLNAVGPETLRAQYEAREVTYLLGELDTDADDPSLDTRCAAELQGRHRFERGQRYHASLGHVYGSWVYARHTLTSVPDAGHGVRAMFTSAEGIEALFGAGSQVGIPELDAPVDDEPVADEPVADEPVADEPVADEPVADEPVAKPGKPGKGLGRKT